MTTIEHEPQACLGCGKMVDTATAAFGEGRPEPGNVTICLSCGHIMVFREGVRLDNPTGEEMYEIAGNKNILAIQRARKLEFSEPERIDDVFPAGCYGVDGRSTIMRGGTDNCTEAIGLDPQRLFAE